MRYFGYLLGILVAVPLKGTWIDTRYSDFQQGTYDAEIYVSRRLQTETNPNDSGCIEYHARFDVNNDGWYDLVSADGGGPNLTVWLGSSTGYSVGNCLTYPITAGGNCDVSDLNLDGYPELIHSDMHGMGSNLCVYWGTVTGPSQTDTTLLPSNNGEAVYVADFDKDTYLDIAMAGDETFYIYWGSPGGTHGVQYSITNRLDITVSTVPALCHNIEASDLDKNGLLDIMVPTKLSSSLYVTLIFYQNNPRNFTQDSLYFSNGSATHGLSIGDLDKNGYTDIVTTGYGGNAHSYIYWGSFSGYSDTNRLTLNPGQCYSGSAVADFNNDSLLDILYYRGKEASGLWWKPIIYYNSGTSPFFSDADTHEVGILLNATGGTVADFNQDGSMDVFVNSNIPSGYSFVFYGPNFTSYDSLPVSVDHHGTFREPRQIPNYYSKVCQPCSIGTDTLITGGTVSWIANEPDSSKVYIYVRLGNTPAPDSSWTDWHEISSNPGLIPAANRKYIQYKAKLWWENPAELPNLERVEVNIICGAVGTEEEVGTDYNLSLHIIPHIRSVTIEYRLNGRGTPLLTVFDITGRKVWESRCNENIGSINWGYGNSPGIYFCVLNTGGKQVIKKFIKF